MNLVCVKCQAFMGIKKMGVAVIETVGVPPMPTRIWRADLLACPICGAEMLANFGHEPVAEKHEAGFASALSGLNGHKYVVYSPEMLVGSVTAEIVYVKGGLHGNN